MLSQKVLYIENDVLMEITNMGMIQTLVTEDRKFMIKDGLFCEIKTNDDFQVLVNWRIKKVNVGSKGALGATTQAKVEVVQSFEFSPATPFPVADWHRYSMDEDGSYSSVEVWQRKNDNTYFFTLDGKEYKVKRLKDLYKAFPDKAPALKEYVKEKKYTMENAQQALTVIAYLKTL